MQHVIKDKVGYVNFDLNSRQFDFEVATDEGGAWKSNGVIDALSGENAGMNQHNWSGSTLDQKFTVQFGYVGGPTGAFAATVTRQKNAKSVQIFGDVDSLPPLAEVLIEKAEFTPVALSTTGFLDADGNLFLKERDGNRKWRVG